ncbi:hypothetical protein [Candidatus Nitrosocosmicus hydrocola]|uniref:hypothetical protein n=1 Tax=Candidatus Nitrosocosmicus hydrocola TaxID=1826872 RepID=UPI0011E5ECBA|nr:hypothetical protein [Candidatus Nitrosocosmicus hydrocola]
MNKVCESILDYSKRKTKPRIMIPDLYFEQILENGHVLFDECGVWKSIFVNGNGSVLLPCWKFKGLENTYNPLSNSIDEIWSTPQWDIAKTCHDCKVLGASGIHPNQKLRLRATICIDYHNIFLVRILKSKSSKRN